MGSLASRLDRLEPRAAVVWRRVWERFADRVEQAMPDELHDHAARAPDDEDAWRDFYVLHGLTGLVDWSDKHPGMFPDADTPDLAVWPSSIPKPPPEPTGVRERLQQLERGDDDAGAYAALALLLLGMAHCAREARA